MDFIKSVKLHSMALKLEQNFALPVLASLTWLAVFDTFCGNQATSSTSLKGKTL